MPGQAAARVENIQLVLAKRPTDAVTPDCFERHVTPIVDPGPGQILVRTLWLGFEPAQRAWINEGRSYVRPVDLGEVMRSFGVGEVVASGDPDVPVGTLVSGLLGWQTHLLVASKRRDLEVIPADIEDPKLYLSVAGITGLTAYVGMTEIGRVQPGDTVLVTAAAGATGSVAGQVARNLGAGRVVGTAGSAEKRDWVRDVTGLDECVSHYDDEVRRALRAAAPDGYHVVFDNVGGTLLDAALANVAIGARVVLCGSIATGYAAGRPEVGLHNYQVLTTRRSRMEGFLVTDHEDCYEHARKELLGWVREGKLHVAETLSEGLENAPLALAGLFDGRNLGKQILQVAERST